MRETSAARVAYWSKQVKTSIAKGKPFPGRFCDALARETLITREVSPSGNARYVPDRSPGAVVALTELYRLYPEALKVMLSVKDPVPISDTTKTIRKSKSRKKAETPSREINLPIAFREPKYAKYIAKLIEYGRSVMLVGLTGCGKTRLFYEIASKAGKTVYRVNFDGGMTPDAFMGGIHVRTAKNGDGSFTHETYFQEGPVVKAAQEGAWLLLDELDKAQPEYAAALHAITENIRNPIVLHDDGGRLVNPHPVFRVMAAANTLGNMEESSLGYYGSSPMNVAFKDRFAIMQVEYPPDETSLIDDILDDKDASGKLVKTAKLARQAIAEGKLSGGALFSTRRLIAWASSFKHLGNFEYATELEVFPLIDRYIAGSFPDALSASLLIKSRIKDFLKYDDKSPPPRPENEREETSPPKRESLAARRGQEVSRRNKTR